GPRLQLTSRPAAPMTDWDAAFGEAALGLDLAKLDGIQDGLGHALAGHRGRSSVLVKPAPHRDRPAEPAVAGTAAGPAAAIDADTIFRQEALEFRARGRDTPGGVVRLGSRLKQRGIPDNGPPPRGRHRKHIGHPHRRERLGPRRRGRTHRDGGDRASRRGRPGPGRFARAHRHAPRRAVRPGRRPARAAGQRVVHPAGWARPSGSARHPGHRPAQWWHISGHGHPGHAPADSGHRRAAVGIAGRRPGPSAPLDARPGGRAMSRTIRCIRQMEDADCGAACLAMALEYFGKRVDLSELRDVTGAGRDGVTALSIVNAARMYRLQARGVKPDMGELGLLPHGSILHWDSSHFAVFERTTRRGARIIDPAHGRRIVSLGDLRRSYTGVAIIFEPSGDFDRGTSRGRGTWRYLRPMLRQSKNLVRVLVTSLFLRLAALGLPLLTALVVDEIVPRHDDHLLLVLTLAACALIGYNF